MGVFEAAALRVGVSVASVCGRRWLKVTIDAPRRSRALAAPCADLTDTQTRYPGTDLTFAYSVKNQPNPA